MFWYIIKKQVLLFLRNLQQLILLIALPIILILILGTALGSFMNGESSPITIELAFIEQEDEQEQADRFVEDLKGQIPDEVISDIQSNIEQMMPVKLLKESILDHEDFQDFIKVDYLQPEDLEETLQDDSYTAVIEVPANFTYEALDSMIVGNSTVPVLNVTQNEEEQVGSSIVTSLLTQFQKQLTMGGFLGENGIDSSTIHLDESLIPGDIVTIDEQKPITSKAYYTIGMIVMNVLFIAGAVGYYAFHEKEIKVFNRILLANVSRWVYFSSILASGTILAFLQSMIIFTFSRFVFGISFPNIVAFLAVTVAFSFAVGGIAVLLSAINYRINSETVTNFFISIAVTLLSVLGGSFYPIGDFLPFIQTLGNMTPNGSGMTAYLTILRGGGIDAIASNLLYLGLFGIVSIIIAAFCFPKRGVSA